MRSPRHTLAALAALAAAVVLTGCGSITSNAPRPEFSECGQTTDFSFVGETSLDAIGLGDAGPESSRVGMVWVTADAIAMPGGPMPIGAGPEPAAARMVCVEWPDGSGMSMTINDDWQPPLAGTGTSAPASGEELPIGLIGLLVALGVLVGVSVLAFRERPTGG